MNNPHKTLRDMSKVVVIFFFRLFGTVKQPALQPKNCCMLQQETMQVRADSVDQNNMLRNADPLVMA